MLELVSPSALKLVEEPVSAPLAVLEAAAAAAATVVEVEVEEVLDV